MRAYIFIKILVACILLCCGIGYGQTLPLSIKASLPTILTESSGLAATNKNSIWSHNDNSGNTELYNFDSTGALLRTLKILNATNVDWEDLAKDTAGNFFIGDIGNNANTRQDLKIYKIPNPSLIIPDSVAAQVINYSYPDQFAFPPPDSMKNFDSEAMVAFNDSLYIFSKDWSNPFSGYTKLYRLPATAGTYVAELIDSFYTGPGPYIIYAITGAGVSPDQTRLMLIGYKKCWLFTNYNGADFFSGTCHVFDFADLTQKEAVCFLSSGEVYITDESSSGSGQKLYYLNLAPYLSAGLGETGAVELVVFPNPFTEGISVKVKLKQPGHYSLVVYDASGRSLYKESILAASTEIKIDKKVFEKTAGLYFVGIEQNNRLLFFKRVSKQL